MIECRASMFPLVNSTKVSTAVHSTQYFNSQLFHRQRVTFWRPSFFNSKYLLAPLGAGLIFIPVPASAASTSRGGDSPSYSGFFHCLAVFDDRSSLCSSPGSLLLCTESFSTSPSSCVALIHSMQPFNLTCATTCLLVYSNLEALKLVSCSSQ